jgi:hypothetical protein
MILTAKPVIKNKFWIVEQEGKKIATIQAVDNGGFVYVNNDQRRVYPSIKILSKVHNVVFDPTVDSKNQIAAKDSAYGYPVEHKAYNVLWNVKHQFPVFTKSKKSKSFYCAGWYKVKLNGDWSETFCPKLITLNRYEFAGPFKTKQEAIES